MKMLSMILICISIIGCTYFFKPVDPSCLPSVNNPILITTENCPGVEVNF